MAKTFQTERRVEFRDTDAAGIVHFSVFFQYMEQAEHEFLRHLGLSVEYHDGQRTIGWPRVAAKCEYRQPIRFEQVIQLEVSVEKIGTKSVTYRHRLTYQDSLIAEGMVTAVCCKLNSGQAPTAIEIPPDFATLLKQYLVSQA